MNKAEKAFAQIITVYDEAVEAEIQKMKTPHPLLVSGSAKIHTKEIFGPPDTKLR